MTGNGGKKLEFFIFSFFSTPEKNIPPITITKTSTPPKIIPPAMNSPIIMIISPRMSPNSILNIPFTFKIILNN